jgi:hypothetical protein
MRFKMTQFVKEYVQKTEEEWGYVEVKQKFICPTYDDLQNLILTLVDCSSRSVKFEIEKEEVEDNE